MTDFEYENGIANNSLANDKEDAFVNQTESEENHDTEITRLFEDARDELEMVDANARKQKRQIVVDLARSLEGKVATESICMEIINQLRGQVRERTIRACLDEKYKQKTRMENARKQKRQTEETDLEDNLAALMPLNQDEEEEEEEKKELVIVDVDGRTMLQKDNEEKQNDEVEDDEQFTITMEPSTTKHGSLTEVQPHPPQEHDKEPNNCAYNNDVGTSNDILHFEFSVPYKDTQRYMQELFQKTGTNGRVWVSGKINTKTGMVITSTLGRMNQQI